VKTLQRYLIKECATPFFLSYTVATFMFLVRQLRDQADRFVQVGAQLSDVARIVLLSVPLVSVYVLPIAVLLGVVFGVARLSKDTEMVALRASGIPLKQLAPPLLAVGALLSVICFGVIEGFGPTASARARRVLATAILRHPAALANPGQWMEFGGMRMKVESGDPESGTMEGVEIVLFEDDQPTIVVNAARGAFEKGADGIPVLQLWDIEMHQQGKSAVTWLEWSTLPLDFTSGSVIQQVRDGGGVGKPEELHIRELVQALSLESLRPKKRNKLRNELGERCSLPFACFFFVLVGLPLAGRNVRAGRSYGLALAFMTIIVYYVLLMFGQTLVEREWVNPILANWLPNIVLGSIGFVLLKRPR
jgi:LPS export ABC transporter permease LptF